MRPVKPNPVMLSSAVPLALPTPVPPLATATCPVSEPTATVTPEAKVHANVDVLSVANGTQCAPLVSVEYSRVICPATALFHQHIPASAGEEPPLGTRAAGPYQQV